MKCAYCDTEGKMTREHVVPKGFIDHMDWDNQLVMLEKAPSRLINSELKVKDVCANCNNVALSNLDAYALNFFMDINDKRIWASKKFQLKYDFDMLSRWLLKICYNSSRANDSANDSALYKKNVGYILRSESAKSFIAFYGLSAGYSLFGDEFVSNLYHCGVNRVFEFDWFRIGPFRQYSNIYHKCAFRYVMINSLAFLVVVSDDEEEFKKFKETIKKSNFKFSELSPNGKTWLKKDETFLFQSFYSNMELKDNYGKKRDIPDDSLKILPITRDELERKAFDSLEWYLDKYAINRDTILDEYQNLCIEIQGYDEEIREIYQIKEYQEYIRMMFDEYPQIIWFINLNPDDRNPFFAMLHAYVNSSYILSKDNNSRRIEVDNSRVSKLLLNFYGAINTICNNNAFDESKVDEMTRNINTIIGKGLGIDLNT